jgi:F0F1-type ATP synthase epsilon subunit
MPMTFDIITARGLAVHKEGLDRIVIRRREMRFSPGSEVGICAHHGPLLMQTQGCAARLTRGGRTVTVDVEPGVLEVLDDLVTLVIT